MKKYTYTLYDEDYILVGVFENTNELAKFLGKSQRYIQDSSTNQYLYDIAHRKYYLHKFCSKELEETD